MTRARVAVDERLKRRVEIVDGCWLWQGALDRNGYGKMTIDGRTVGAHRVSYALFVGDLADGMHVLHSCDTPRCVNPDHLSEGTHADNMREKAERGRAPHGEAHPHARLTVRDVREIRRRRAAGETLRALSCAYGVGQTAIFNIVHGIKWAHA